MSSTDPIADLLTRLRNGAQARKQYIECPFVAAEAQDLEDESVEAPPWDLTTRDD